jgi:ribonuclease HI
MNNSLSKSLTIFSDGGSRGNPGPAAYGFVVYDDNNKEELYKGSNFLGEATNNQAEYRGVLAALEYISTNIINTNDTLRQSLEQANNIENIQINFYLDSELIVKQMNGEYKIKNEDLKPIYWQIRELIMKLGGKVSFAHVPREKNKIADKLVNIELDRNIKNK